MDITAALVVYGYLGLKPVPLLQGIASGLLGPKSFQGGLATALLGLLSHFVIAFWGGCCLLCGEPRHSTFDTVCGHFRRAVWRGRVFLHESRCVAALRCRQASLFPDTYHRRRGHSHFLCRTSGILQPA